MAHHKNAIKGRCFLFLQLFSFAVSVWAERFPPQEQHSSMQSGAACGCGDMLELLKNSQREQLKKFLFLFVKKITVCF